MKVLYHTLAMLEWMLKTAPPKLKCVILFEFGHADPMSKHKHNNKIGFFIQYINSCFFSSVMF